MDQREPNLARASMWMALGTIVSRATGLLRMLMLFWAIGGLLNADIFNNANTIPNSMYILVAGGIFNVVLVPQLVRTMKFDTDSGEAYANRVVTVGLTVLFIATIALILLVPWLLHVVFSTSFFQPGLEEQRHTAIVLMQLCMPQVFFYGAFVLLGQVLNARRRFGPMMWAPITNNVVACSMLGLYIVVWGSSNAGDGFSTSQTLLLGVGSTIGIAAQFATLVPFLRLAGFRYRPRFDWRGVGLSHTLKLSAWTLMTIIANQVVFIVVHRLGTDATSRAAVENQPAAGAAVYDLGYLVSQVPHGIVTVSLTTAIMPTLSTLAAEGLNDRVRTQLTRTLRIAVVIIAPLAVMVACLGPQAIDVGLSFGAISGQSGPIALTMQLFAPAIVVFSLQYVIVRGFYAREDTRTPFLIQVAIGAINAGAAVVLTSIVAPAKVAAMLGLSLGVAYTVGMLLATTLLSRKIGRILDASMVRFAVRLAIACAITALVIVLCTWILQHGGFAAVGVPPDSVSAAIVNLVLAGLLGAGAYWGSSRAMRIDELDYAIATVLRRRGA